MENFGQTRLEPVGKTFDLFGDHTIDRESLTGQCPGAEVFMRELKGPITVAWNVTESCNLRCLHCFNNSGPGKPDELSREESLRLVDELREMKVYNVCLCGGEPLLRKDLFEIADRLSNDGILVSMVSNGYLLDKKAATDLASAGVRFLQVSIDGITAETHERLRGKQGSFERAVKAAGYVADAGMELALAFCPTRFNIGEFAKYVEMAHELGAKMIRMMPLLRLGRTIRNKDVLIPSAEQMVEFIWTVREKGLEYIDRDLSIEWGDPLEHLYLFPYNKAKLFILEIHANGDLGISAYLPLTFGNIRNRTLREHWDAGLKDAWRHPKTLESARKIMDLDDLQKGEAIPWEGRGVHVDLFNGAKKDRIVSHNHNPRASDDMRFRDEGKGIRSLFPVRNRNIRQVHFLNRTAVQIYELCNGDNSAEDILNVLRSRFPDVDRLTLEQDMKECLYTLRTLELIAWDDGEQTASKGMTAKVAEERDFKRIASFIASHLESNGSSSATLAYMPVHHKAYYLPIAIRMRQFHNREIFFLVEQDGEVCAVASIAAMGPPLKSSQISTFLASEAGGVDAPRLLLDSIFAMMKRIGLIKLKCGVFPSSNGDEFLSFLLGGGFQQEARLAHEMGRDEDIIIYSRII